VYTDLTFFFHLSFLFFVVLFIGIKSKNPSTVTSPPALGSEQNPWGCLRSGSVALPVVLPTVHHRQEPLDVPTKVNTLQVDGLARIPGLTQAPYRRILSHQ